VFSESGKNLKKLNKNSAKLKFEEDSGIRGRTLKEKRDSRGPMSRIYLENVKNRKLK